MAGVACIIPARYASSRFPGKVLADLGGKPVLQHVFERARRAKRLDLIIIATDDERIAEAAAGFGARKVMTDPLLPSGTDRAAAALTGIDADIVVNLQGDEPFIEPADIDRLVEVFGDDRGVEMASLMCPIDDEGRFRDPNLVKVVVDRRGCALYFSRAAIPFPRGGRMETCFQHIGVYAFKRELLERFVSWPTGRLEEIEKLEQLRALERGVKIHMIEVERAPLGIDTREDLERARKSWGKQGIRIKNNPPVSP